MKDPDFVFLYIKFPILILIAVVGAVGFGTGIDNRYSKYIKKRDGNIDILERVCDQYPVKLYHYILMPTFKLGCFLQQDLK